ncbi:MAG: hypothetical protein ABL952_15915 [Pyrinomonadaceae bacterium]
MGINSYEPTDIEAKNGAEVQRWLVFDPLVDDESPSPRSCRRR